MNKKEWYDDDKNLATKPIFHIIWFGVWCCGLIIGSKGVAYSIGWKAYLIVIMSFLMLAFQIECLIEVLRIYNKIRNSKLGSKG